MFFIFNLVLVKQNDLFVRNVFLLVTEYVFKNIKIDDIFFHNQKKIVSLWTSTKIVYSIENRPYPEKSLWHYETKKGLSVKM